MNVREILKHAVAQLAPHSDSASLDAELLLAHTLGTSRTWLFTYSDHLVTPEQVTRFEAFIKARSEGQPIAYLLGTREFWSLPFIITQDTLVPRPDTELLVSLVLSMLPETPYRIADLGTGSGAIALSLAHARPQWEITATDVCAQALEVARKNAHALQIHNVRFQQGDWCESLGNQRFHVIVSNPPYLSETDPHLQGEIQHEPRHALISGPSGLEALHHLILTAKDHILPGGALFLEHGTTQAPAVHEIFASAGYHDITTHHDLSGQDRVTVGFFADR